MLSGPEKSQQVEVFCFSFFFSSSFLFFVNAFEIAGKAVREQVLSRGMRTGPHCNSFCNFCHCGFCLPANLGTISRWIYLSGNFSRKAGGARGRGAQVHTCCECRKSQGRLSSFHRRPCPGSWRCLSGCHDRITVSTNHFHRVPCGLRKWYWTWKLQLRTVLEVSEALSSLLSLI